MGDAGMTGRENGSHAAAAEPSRFVEVEMEDCENGAAIRSVAARAAKKQSRPAAALCAELVLPGGVVLLSLVKRGDIPRMVCDAPE